MVNYAKLQDAATQAKKTDAPQPDDDGEEETEAAANEDESEGDGDSAAQKGSGDSNKTDSVMSASPKKNKKSDLDIDEKVNKEQVSDEPTQTEVKRKKNVYKITTCNANLFHIFLNSGIHHEVHPEAYCA